MSLVLMVSPFLSRFINSSTAFVTYVHRYITTSCLTLLFPHHQRKRVYVVDVSLSLIILSLDPVSVQVLTYAVQNTAGELELFPGSRVELQDQLPIEALTSWLDRRNFLRRE